jgi:hypothetical protein
MESRFRVRFWSRRARTAPSELDLHSVPYQAASESSRKPVFIHQPLGRNLSERRKQNDTSALRGFSYLASDAGKPPVVGDRPHKGNGPVKLNASRRLSSGDLQVTSHDQQHVLENIRDGEYDVAGREGRASRSFSITRPVTGERRQSHSSTNAQSPSLRHPPISAPASWAPFPGASPLLEIPEDGQGRSAARPAFAPNRSSTTDSFARPGSVQSSSATDGLGISDFAPMPQGILKKSTSLASLAEPSSEQSATIRALWKAEYKQLVAIYGETGVNKKIGDGPWEQKRLSTIQDVAYSAERPVPFSLEPLPRPSFEPRDGAQRRSSRQSKNEHVQQDDTSDESSHQRLSFISSAGYASSYTTRASVAESDSINTTQDIRKIVENMRSTYIQAIEAREPSMQALKSIKKRKKRSSATAQSTPRASSNPTTPEMERRSSAHAHAHANPSSPSLRSQRSTRVVSQPVATISTLPAIEASPTRTKEPEVGLKRADSSTLGALMGESRRASISKRKSERSSRRPSPTSRSRRESSKSEKQAPGEKETFPAPAPEAADEDMISLFRDIFSSSNDDFWKGSPALTTTLTIASPASSPPPAVAVHSH